MSHGSYLSDHASNNQSIPRTMKELIAIQSQLKAPKGNYNSFGKYKYRSAEDILEAVKPLLAEQECTLVLSDNIQLIGNRFYIVATATLTNSHGEAVHNQAYAREDEMKKGMDGSQITGTASSYARKYALNGLFLIDDTKDADTDEFHNQTHQQPSNPAEAVADASSTLTTGDLIQQTIDTLRGIRTRNELEAYYRSLPDAIRANQEVIDVCSGIAQSLK